MFYNCKFYISVLIILLSFSPLHAQSSYDGDVLSTLTGRVVSWRSGKVSTQIPGLVKSLHVKIGDSVKQGDILAIMDSRLLISNMDQARLELAESHTKATVAKAKMALKKDFLARQNKLRKTISFQKARYREARLIFEITRAEYRAATARVKIQEGILKRKQLDIKLSTIFAPYDGVVSQVFTQPGAFITAETPNVVEMIDNKSLEIEVDIAVQDTENYKKGTIVIFKYDNQHSFRAKIRSLLPNINIRTQTRPVRFTPLDKIVIKNIIIGQDVTLIQPKNSD